MAQDFAEHHVARWRDHWIDLDFDEEVEKITVRIGAVNRYLRDTTHAVLAEMDLPLPEYETLHMLMIRDTPGIASPSELAAEMGVSAPGMTGRLDTLERKGWVKRTTGRSDRRRVDVEVTRKGVATWRAAMLARGATEDDLATALTPAEQRTLNRLLKKLTLKIEAGGS